MSLQTGTELISLALAFNKITGLYGLLAILTGYGLSGLQLAQFTINVLALVVLGWCIPHIRKQTPLPNLTLAWVYLVDTTVGMAFTALFATSWFLTSAALGDDAPEKGDTEEVDGMASHEAAVSLVLIIALALVRLYCAAVVMSHTSVVLQNHTEAMSRSEEAAGSVDVGNPFAQGTPAGEGWRGKAGRAMASVGQEYWLGPRKDEDWEARMKPKFRGASASEALERP